LFKNYYKTILLPKLLSTSNGFGVQLTETISTAKWFWNTFGCNIIGYVVYISESSSGVIVAGFD